MAHKIIDNLWLGDDEDVPKMKERGYSRLACCKDGIDSHRSMLGYTTMSAPKNKEYLVARRGNVMALNLIDVDEPEYISDDMLNAGLNFMHEQYTKGNKLFVHCNAGHSRSPSMTMMFLRSIGELPDTYYAARKIFKTLYPKYDPGKGMLFHTKRKWEELGKDFYAV